MRLTNYLRDSFIRNVKNQLPTKAWPHLEEVQRRVVNAMDPVLRAVYENEHLRGALQTTYYSHHDSMSGRGMVVVGNISLSDVLKDEREYNEKMAATMAKIRAAAYAASTLKQLREVLPDLVDYMPSENGAPALKNAPVVVSIKSELEALGFPKDKQ